MGKDFKPYVGLRPFYADESLIFFGREQQTLELLQRLHRHYFVAVVGTSGCGKSSLIRAGLIPALKGGYLVEESDKWFIAKMKPGGKPLYNLAESINEQIKMLDPNNEGHSNEELIERIEDEGVDAILDLIKPLYKSRHINFFLLIDQFEELFDFAKKEPRSRRKNEATGFVNIMLDLAEQTDIPFYVVMTMRSDFIGDCTEYYRLPEALNESQYLVPRLTRSELRQVIEGPAKLSRLRFDPALTSKLLNEVGKFQDELPVLQHALLRMWQSEVNNDNDGQINFSDYERIGGLNHALSKDANEAFDDLSAADKKIAEQIFKSLTTIDASGRKIRKRTALQDLMNVCNVSRTDIERVINVFIENDRSFIIYDTEKGLDQIIDISHESLIRQWNKLGKWVNAESVDIKYYKGLSEKQKAYYKEVRERGLLDDIEFEKAQQWFEDFNPNESWTSQFNNSFKASQRFYEESRLAYDKRKRKEASKRKRKKILQYASIAAIVTLAAWSWNKFVVEPRSAKPIPWEELKLENDDFKAFLRVKAKNTSTHYDEFLTHFPNSGYAQEVRDSMYFRKFDDDWMIAEGIDNYQAYDNYLYSAVVSTDNTSTKGKELFNANCSFCHSLNSRKIGPPLENVEERLSQFEKDRKWISQWIKDSRSLIKSGDPYAKQIYNTYSYPCQSFPDLTEQDIDDILAYTNPDNNYRVYSEFARDIGKAKVKIESLKSSEAVKLDNDKWEEAVKDSSVTAYLNYYMDNTILGLHNSEALKNLKMVGIIGRVRAGQKIENYIQNRVFDLKKTNHYPFALNNMLSIGDVVEAKYNIRVINDSDQTSYFIKPGQLVYIVDVLPTDSDVEVGVRYDKIVDKTVDGENVTLVNYTNNSGTTGSFVKTGKKTWIEINNDNPDGLSFEEEKSDATTVYLFDPSRNVQIILDLEAKEVYYAIRNADSPDSPPVLIYFIIDALKED